MCTVYYLERFPVTGKLNIQQTWNGTALNPDGYCTVLQRHMLHKTNEDLTWFHLLGLL